MEPKENLSKRIGDLLGIVALSALPGRDRGEQGRAPLHIFAAAVRAQNFTFLIATERENLIEEFLAILTEEFVVGHGDLDCLGGLTEF